MLVYQVWNVIRIISICCTFFFFCSSQNSQIFASLSSIFTSWSHQGQALFYILFIINKGKSVPSFQYNVLQKQLNKYVNHYLSDSIPASYGLSSNRMDFKSAMEGLSLNEEVEGEEGHEMKDLLAAMDQGSMLLGGVYLYPYDSMCIYLLSCRALQQINRCPRFLNWWKF